MTLPSKDSSVSLLGALLRGAWPYLAAFVVAVVAYYGVPQIAGDFQIRVITLACISIIMAVSLNVVNGYTGQFSIGHAGFMAVGAYVSGFITYYGSFRIWGDAKVHGGFLGSGDMLFLSATLAGGLAAAVCGFLVGLPTLRLRGDYLAIVTLAFGEILRVLIKESKEVLTRPEDIAKEPIIAIVWEEGRPALDGLLMHIGGAFGFPGLPTYNNLFWTILWMLITLIVCYRIKASMHGAAFLSIRENEIAAEAMGVNTTRYKVGAFMLAAFFGGIGGSLFAHETGVLINANEMAFMKSLDYVFMIVLGGLGSISGAVLSAIALTIIPEVLRQFQDYRMVVYAILVLLVMILRPGGLFGIKELWELKWVHRLLARVGLARA